MVVRIIVCVSIVFLSISLNAQQLYSDLNTYYNSWLDKFVSKKESKTISAFKPYLYSSVDYADHKNSDSEENHLREYKSFFMRKLKHENMLVVDTGNFNFTLDPILSFEIGIDKYDTTSKRLSKNTRGLIVKGNIGSNISFMSAFVENQAFLPTYQSQFVSTHDVVPGQGRIKPFKVGGFDYAMASGYISYSPLKQMNVQFGHDKNFIGDGYRSLLLSDNTSNYPFLKFNTSFFEGKIHYMTLYASMQNLERIPFHKTPETIYKRKAASFHLLGLNLAKWLQVSLFEGIIWQRWDTTGTTSFDYNFVNPVFGVNSLIYGLSGKNNAVLGATVKVALTDKITLYAQGMADDFKAKKLGYQAGFKLFDLFKLKNLYLQAEYNSVSPYSYGHFFPLQNYSHSNQPLTHPLGAGFSEFVGILSYRFRDFYLSFKGNYAKTTDDNNVYHFGSNIFNSYTIKTPDAIPRTEISIYNYDINLSYLVNRKNNFNIVIGTQGRIKSGAVISHVGDQMQFVYVGFRTTLTNTYFDF